MKYNHNYATNRSKWYLCFCCLWSRCCIAPDAATRPQLYEEWVYLNENTKPFFHQTDWEKLYPTIRNFRLVKEAEQEAGMIYKAYINDTLPLLENQIPSLYQNLKFWRWLNSHRDKSLLHDDF